MNNKSQAKIFPIILFCLVLVGIFSAYFVFAGSPQEKDTTIYTASSDTICNNGVCNLVLYSGIRNVYEDDQWKRVEDARSLKGKGFNVIYLENDQDFDLQVLDFNMNSIDLSLDFKGNWEDYPEDCEEKVTGDIKCKFELKDKWEEWNETTQEFDEFEIEYEQEFELEEGQTKRKIELKILGNPFGKEFKFGGNSTTIKLQEADTENLADVTLTNPSDKIDGIMIKFNISSIPENQGIDNATLGLYMYSPFGGDALNLYRIPNQTWSESDSNVTLATVWDTKTDLDNTQETGTAETVNTLDITDYVQTEYNANNDSVSIGMDDPVNPLISPSQLFEDTQGMAIGWYTAPVYYGQTRAFYTKEYLTNISRRPYLQITYTLIAPFPTLNKPDDTSVKTTPIEFNCSVISESNELTNITLRIWNSTGDIFYNATNITTGLYNESIQSVAFTYDDTFEWNCLAYDNESLHSWSTSNFTFTTSLSSPAINLDKPTDNEYLDNGTNVYCNFTATDSNGLDTCELWGNWTGTWHNNYTWTGPTSAVQNFTTINISDDGVYVWNVWCNDTLNNGGFRYENFTFTLDETYPTLSIDDISTTPGSQTLTIINTVEDTNLDSCKYSIFDSTGAIDGLNNNVSFTCNSSFQATVTAYASYNLTIYALDLASNENSTTTEFTVTEAGVTVGGGGAPEEVAKIPTIALKQIVGDKIYNELERAVFYARINTFCSIKITSQTLAIQDFSDECSLRKLDIEKIQEELFLDGFQITVNDLILFYEKYNVRELEQVYMTLDIIKTYDLFTSVLGITNPMMVNPPRLDRPFIITGIDGNITIEHTFVVNKKIKECSIISGDGFQCEVITDNSVKMILYINDTDFFDKIFQGEMSITSDADPQNFEVKRISLVPRVYNLSYKIMGIPAIVLLIIGGILILAFSIFFIVRSRIRKTSNKRR